MRKRFWIGITTILAVIVLGAGSSFAATIVWSGLGADDNWSTGGNWVGGTPPSVGDVAAFDDMNYVGNQPIVDAAGAVTVDGITFDSTTSVITLTLNEDLNITAGGAITVSAGGNAVSITTGANWDMNFAGIATVTNNSTGLLTLDSRDIKGAGGNAITFSGTSDITVSAPILDPTSIDVNMTALTDVVTFSGANGYTGSTTITSGMLTTAAGAERIPDGSAVNIAGAAANAGLTMGVSEVIGNLQGSGNITTAGFTLTVTQTVDQTYSGIISGVGSLVKEGASALTLSGANSYTGTTSVNAGTLNVNGVHTGAGAVTVTNAGTVLAGTGTIPSAVTMNTGTILAPGANDGDDVGTITIGGNLVFNGASIYRVSAAGAAADLIIAGANLTATGNVPTVEMQAGYSIAGLAVNTPIMKFTGAYTAFDETNLPASFDIDDAPVGGLVRFIALPATPAAAVPTLNEWGMILTVLLLGFVGVKLMKKQGQGSGNIAC